MLARSAAPQAHDLASLGIAPARPIVLNRGAAERALLLAAGLTPVSVVAATAFGAAAQRLALLVVAPVVACLALRMAAHRPTRRLVTRAVVVGIIATAPYDLWRGSFLWMGLIEHDPFPRFGAALGLDPAWLAGYTWRYIGDGAGLALTFLALGLSGARMGATYGLAVCCCLLLTLIVSPYGTTLLFPLNATTVVMAVGGHVIFGAILGALTAKPRRVSCEHRGRRPSGMASLGRATGGV